MDHIEWLQGFSAQMPVRPPQRLLTYDVQTAPIHRGPDHYIAGVTIVATDDSASPAVALRPITPDQARALARALLHAATDAETQCWSTPGNTHPATEHDKHIEHEDPEPHPPTHDTTKPPQHPDPVETAGVDGGKR